MLQWTGFAPLKCGLKSSVLPLPYVECVSFLLGKIWGCIQGSHTDGKLDLPLQILPILNSTDGSPLHFPHRSR